MRKKPLRRLAPLLLSLVFVSPAYHNSLKSDFERLPQSEAAETNTSYYFKGLPPRATPPENEEELIYEGLSGVLEALGEHVRPYAPPSDHSLLRRIHNFVGGEGVTVPGTNLYRVSPSLSPVERAIALAHEMAHAQLYLPESEAEALGCLALLNSEDSFLQACGAYERGILSGARRVPEALRQYVRASRSPPGSRAVRFLYSKAVPGTSYTSKPDALLRRLEERIGCDGVARLRRNP